MMANKLTQNQTTMQAWILRPDPEKSDLQEALMLLESHEAIVFEGHWKEEKELKDDFSKHNVTVEIIPTNDGRRASLCARSDIPTNKQDGKCLLYLRQSGVVSQGHQMTLTLLANGLIEFCDKHGVKKKRRYMDKKVASPAE